MAAQTGDGREHIFNITMAPILTLDLRDRRDVARAERRSFAGQKHQRNDGDEQEVFR